MRQPNASCRGLIEERLALIVMVAAKRLAREPEIRDQREPQRRRFRSIIPLS